MTLTSAISAAAGGAIIGLAATMFLVLHGRTAGISGILTGALTPARGPSRAVDVGFLLGLTLVGLVARVAVPAALGDAAPSAMIAIVAGLLVGFGTRLGSGCTSGHGVCGISRFSIRSVAATVTFMATGGATVYLVRHMLGGGR